MLANFQLQIQNLNININRDFKDQNILFYNTSNGWLDGKIVDYRPKVILEKLELNFKLLQSELNRLFNNNPYN